MSVSQSIPSDRAIQAALETCESHAEVALPAFPDGSRLLCALCAREARSVAYAAGKARLLQSPMTPTHAVQALSGAGESMGQSHVALENSATGD
jgi:hypothetical protein